MSAADQPRDAAAPSTKAPNLLPRQGLSGGILVAVIGVMVFLAAMALAGGLALSSAVDQWRDALSRDLTVQVAAGPQADAAVERTLAVLAAMPGIATARALPRPELEALLEPWLGAGNVPADLPLPRLVDVNLAPGAKLDAAAIQARLDREAPGAKVDDPQTWLSGVVGLARRAQVLLAAAVALVLAALVAIVIFATRAGLNANRGLVDLLHLIGAHDTYIAGVFQRHFMMLGLKGAVAGLALAALAGLLLVGLGAVGGVAEGAFLGGIMLSPAQWAIIAALAPLVAGMTTLTARITMRRALAGLV
jgi:cell division transport system permease protein